MADEFYEKAFSRWQSLAKPLGGLGLLEEYVCKIASVQKTETPDISRRVLAVFCADNGIVEEGVSQTDSSVTRIVAENLSRGETSVCKMAALAKCEIIGVDCGIIRKNSSQKSPSGFYDFFIANGTENFLKYDAMSRCDCELAIQNGINLSLSLKEKGYNLFATGEMGIGNTTTSSAVLASILDIPPEKVTGRGAGLSDAAFLHKIDVIRSGIAERKPEKKDVVDVLSKVGGFDIATMCGFFLGAQKACVPCIVDGFISGVAALCACRICPDVRSVLLASHLSGELAGKIVLDALGLTPVITAGMHLGEGTGCMTLIPLLDMALEVFFKMPTFRDIKIKAYEPF